MLLYSSVARKALDVITASHSIQSFFRTDRYDRANRCLHHIQHIVYRMFARTGCVLPPTLTCFAGEGTPTRSGSRKSASNQGAHTVSINNQPDLTTPKDGCFARTSRALPGRRGVGWKQVERRMKRRPAIPYYQLYFMRIVQYGRQQHYFDEKLGGLVEAWRGPDPLHQA